MVEIAQGPIWISGGANLRERRRLFLGANPDPRLYPLSVTVMLSEG